MQVLICSEKHYTRYFVIPDDKTLYKVCVKLLKERLKWGWYNPTKPEDVADKVGMTEESINKLPEGAIKAMAIEMLSGYKKAEKNYKDDQNFLNDVKEVIKTPFDPSAKRVIRLRSYGLLEGRSRARYEYEEISLQDAEEV